MIGLSLTASYAMRILACLARDPVEVLKGPEAIATATSVPRAYTVKVLHRLHGLGLIRTKLGRHGGYRLACDPDETTALDVVRAVDGADSLERCLLGLGRCSDGRNCRLHPYWSKERARIEQCLDRISLRYLASIEGPASGGDHLIHSHKNSELTETDRAIREKS